MTRGRTLGPLLALIAAAACQRAEPEPAATPAVAPARTHSAMATPATGSEVVARPGKAILDAGGAAFGRTVASARRFPFGSLRSEVEQAAAAALGAAAVASANEECGAGPMEFATFGGLTLNFQDDRFVGWLAKEGSGAVTSDGIRPGIRLRDLEIARSVDMAAESTLEGEFTYRAADGNAIGGFAAGEGRDRRVTSLYSGVTCFFR